jgi:hypothetical protein
MAYCDPNTPPGLAAEDAWVCKHTSELDRSHSKRNGFLEHQFLYVPDYYKCYKDFKEENTLIFPLDRNRLCDKDVVLYRGQNNVAPKTLDKSKSSFLVPYCECNSYDNGLVCDGTKCCSKSHQLFMNHTRRQGVKKCPLPSGRHCLSGHQ